MEQNISNFSIEEAKRMVQSKAGKQLLSILQAQNPQKMQAAMKQASSGDIEQLKETLGAFMATPEVQSLLKQLENRSNE